MRLRLQKAVKKGDIGGQGVEVSVQASSLPIPGPLGVESGFGAQDDMLHPEKEREDVVILDNDDSMMEAGLDLVDPVPGPSRAAWTWES